MFEVIRNKKHVVFTILDGCLSTATFLFSLYLFANLLKGKFEVAVFIILFFLLSASYIIQGILRKLDNKKGMVRRFFTAGIYFFVGLMYLIWGLTLETFNGMVILYCINLIIGRVFAILRAKKWAVRIINIIVIIVLLDLVISLPGNDLGNLQDLEDLLTLFYTVLGLISFTTFIHIMAISFSQIKLNILMKIIRKTYATEIIFGLLMLICAFSYVLMFTEPAVKDYSDGLWYCFAIVTTIGFGDITAVTTIGRILSVILGIYGIIVVAVVTSIIITFYGEVKDTNDDDDNDTADTGATDDNTTDDNTTDDNADKDTANNHTTDNNDKNGMNTDTRNCDKKSSSKNDKKSRKEE